MGVKTVMAGLTFTNTDKATAIALGLDLADFNAGIQLTCQELIQKLNFLVNDVLTPSSDSSNVTTLNTEITALS